MQTGSTYPITSSWALNSLYSVTASYLINSDSVVQCFTGSNLWIFNHNLNARPVVVQAYDQYHNQLIPETVYLNTENTAILRFSTPETGCAIATRSGLRTINNNTSGSGLLNLTGSTTNGVLTYNGLGGANVQNNIKVESGYVILSQVSSSLNFINDSAAALGGVPLGGLYRNGNSILIRIS
jgi:hypothetical protein